MTWLLLYPTFLPTVNTPAASALMTQRTCFARRVGTLCAQSASLLTFRRSRITLQRRRSTGKDTISRRNLWSQRSKPIWNRKWSCRTAKPLWRRTYGTCVRTFWHWNVRSVSIRILRLSTDVWRCCVPVAANPSARRADWTRVLPVCFIMLRLSETYKTRCASRSFNTSWPANLTKRICWAPWGSPSSI